MSDRPTWDCKCQNCREPDNEPPVSGGGSNNHSNTLQNDYAPNHFDERGVAYIFYAYPFTCVVCGVHFEAETPYRRQ